MLTLSVKHSDNSIVKQVVAISPYLAFKSYCYQEGDYIELSVDTVPGFYWIQFDEALPESLVYLTEKIIRYSVVLDEEMRRAFSPKIFSGERHYLTARQATAKEINEPRNLTLNPHDQKECQGIFPHAFANVETRNDSTFFARNAIDGMVANDNHGSYPYQSWGINQQSDAEITVDFGREVEIDELNLVLRGDYPHDSYWTEITVGFSTGEDLKIYPNSSLDWQKFNIQKVKTQYVKLSNLVKNTDESPFPALTELAIYGVESVFDKSWHKNC